MPDLDGMEPDSSVSGSDTVDCHELADLIQAARVAGFESPDGQAQAVTPDGMAASLLCALLDMHFKPEERNEPFGPMIVMNGRRSPQPSDFVAKLDLIEALVSRCSHPAIRARLSDVCWLLDRRRWRSAVAAVSAYTAVVQSVARCTSRYRFGERGDVLTHDTCDNLRRALYIGSAVGADKPEVVELKGLAAELRQRAMSEAAPMAFLWLAEIDLQFGITPGRAGLGEAAELVAGGLPIGQDDHLTVSLWQFASKAYFRANRSDDAQRCRAEAAESLVRQADMALGTSALTASTLLGSAIAQLGGSPTQKARRAELRHRLVDLQAHVTDQLSSFSHPMDLRQLAEAVEHSFQGADLIEKLFRFAALTSSPVPEELRAAAEETIRSHPLSSLFGASHLDRQGKVIHRTSSSALGKADAGAIDAQIAQAEAVRRHVVVGGYIDVARQIIANEHHVHADGILCLIGQSPAVPPELTSTFASGFTRMFQGDYTGATYTLVPNLEAMLRHVLKSVGHDVTIFDDASQTQQDRTISTMFEQMRSEIDGVFGAALTTDMENVFLVKPGPHLRHALAHGLLDDGSPHEAAAVYGCWLIFRLAMLPLFSYRNRLVAPVGWRSRSTDLTS